MWRQALWNNVKKKVSIASFFKPSCLCRPILLEIWVGYTVGSVFASSWTERRSRSIVTKAKKIEDQYPAILVEPAWSIKDFLQDRTVNPELTRLPHLSRSGSQPQCVVHVARSRNFPYNNNVPSHLLIYMLFYRVLKVPLAYQADQACLPQRFVWKTKPNAVRHSVRNWVVKRGWSVEKLPDVIRLKQLKEVWPPRDIGTMDWLYW